VMILNRFGNDVLWDFILNPEVFETDACVGARFMFTGFTWYHVLAEKNRDILQDAYSAWPDGRVIIHTGTRLEQTELLRRLACDLHAKGKLGAPAKTD
jgi:hypothetical protein